MASQRKQATTGKDEGVDIRPVQREEAAFILGQGGKTKAKLAAVSGATIELQEISGRGGAMTNQLSIKGTPQQRKYARKYIDFVLAQRNSPVKIANPSEHDDLTLIQVPSDTVSFITGTKGYFLRLVEEEWSALLFFLSVNPRAPPTHVEQGHLSTLAIFGAPRSRRGAELKVMAAVEMKQQGHFTKNVRLAESSEEGFATDTVPIHDEDYSYALGRGGSTRKKLARASNCIVEYVGRVAYFCGTKPERRAAKEYLHWLLMQRVGDTVKVDYKDRDDATMVMVPGHCIGYVAGTRGTNLRSIEEETSTFCFIEGFADEHEDHKPLLIFGRKQDRSLAESMVWERMSHKFDELENGDGGKGKRKGKGKGKGKSKDGKGKSHDYHGDKDDGVDRADSSNAAREKPKDAISDTIAITADDAAFLMGPGGRVRNKISAVSGAYLDLKQLRVDVYGSTKLQVVRARKYILLVMAQRVGPVKLEDAEDHDDLSLVEVPAEAVSFVTGKQGSFLRLVEEEFATLLFFIDFSKSSRRDTGLEKMAIFGAMRDRRGAELKVMAAVEMKQPGFIRARDAPLPMQDPQEGFSTDRLEIMDDDYSYALGKGGATRKKIARASGCIIEYVGRFAYLSGVKKERARARDYLIWLFCQRVGPVEVDYSSREDVTVLQVPKDCVGFVTGFKGTSLRAVEESTGTFCFIEGGREDPNRDPKPLLIFGGTEARGLAEVQLRQRIDQKLEEGWVHEEGGSSGGWYSSSWSGGYSGGGGGGGWSDNYGKGDKGGGKHWRDYSSKGKGRGKGNKGKDSGKDGGHSGGGAAASAPAVVVPPPSFGASDWPTPAGKVAVSQAAEPAPAAAAAAAAPAAPAATAEAAATGAGSTATEPEPRQPAAAAAEAPVSSLPPATAPAAVATAATAPIAVPVVDQESTGGCVALRRHAVSMDNSCLFAAFAFLCEGTSGDTDLSITRRLREVCARAALEDPDPTTRELMLGQAVGEYAEWIRDDNHWGGEHEVLALARHYCVEVAIAVCDGLRVLVYGGDTSSEALGRIYLLYTGQHYDAFVGVAADGREMRILPRGDDERLDALALEDARTLASTRWSRLSVPHSGAAALAAASPAAPARSGAAAAPAGAPSAKACEDAALPPFLLHEEAWPDLGMRGKKKGK